MSSSDTTNNAVQHYAQNLHFSRAHVHHVKVQAWEGRHTNNCETYCKKYGDARNCATCMAEQCMKLHGRPSWCSHGQGDCTLCGEVI